MAIPFTVRLTDKPHLIGKGELCRISKAVFTDWKCKRCIFYCFLGVKNFFHKFLFSYLSGIFPGTFPFSFYIIHAAFYSNKNFLFIREHLPTPFPSPFWLSLNPEGEAVGHRSDLLTRFFRVFRRFSRCSALSAANWEQLPHILETAAGGNQAPFLNMTRYTHLAKTGFQPWNPVAKARMKF